MKKQKAIKKVQERAEEIAEETGKPATVTALSSWAEDKGIDLNFHLISGIAKHVTEDKFVEEITYTNQGREKEFVLR